MYNDNKLVELSKEWLKYHIKDKNIETIEILPQFTSYGLVVWLYVINDDGTEDELPCLTIPMVTELLSGKNPKNINNKYLKGEKTEKIINIA